MFKVFRSNFARRFSLENVLLKRLNQTTFYSTNEGALKNIRVLDMTRIVAGPFCSMILGDMGADIIKIENPISGDECRKWGPPYVNNTNETCYFVSLNRNKKSMCVDFKTDEGREIILELSKKCDVLIENYVPGKMDELGLGYNEIKKVSPHLVYCSLSGYGCKGPYKNKPGYDVIAASVGGLLSITGPKDGPPCKVGVAMTDLATGLFAHGAIMAALIHRFNTGKGQKIDCNLLSTQLACLINIGSNYLNAGEEGEKWGSSHVSIVPYRAYETSDGYYLTICAGSNLQFQELSKKLGISNEKSNMKFKDNKDRIYNRDILDSIIQDKFKEKTLKEWLNILEGSSFPFGPVNTISQAFNDEHVKDIGIVKEIDHPIAGKVKIVGSPVEFSESKTVVHLPPPLLGEHTADILKTVLNYSEEKIKHLKIKKIF